MDGREYTQAPMETAAAKLTHAIETFRRDHVLGFLQRLSGQPVSVSHAQRWLVSERAEECLANALGQGELSPGEHGAIAAHMARAQLELTLASGRARVMSWPATALAVEGETRPVNAMMREWLASDAAPKRMRIAREIASSIPPVLHEWMRARENADAAAGALLRRLAAPRHADAGPEGGATALAQTFLRDTQDLMREAVSYCCSRSRVDSEDGTEALWAMHAPRYGSIFGRENRMRRLGNDWDALGLRRALAVHARAAPSHPAVFPQTHVLVASAPRDVRVSAPTFEHGLLSELASADAVGRAVGITHASAALPISLRHATVASVPRALGALGVGMFAQPLFLSRVRNLSRREADEVSRFAATYALLDARLCAAAVLARNLHGDNWLNSAAELATSAITRTVPQALGAWLVTRVSPGSALRAKVHAFAIAQVLREQFDEDWFRNPRAGEPLRGAAARAGDFAVEAFAAELGADISRPLLLSALF